MKNYKFVVGLLLSSMVLHPAQAGSPTPSQDVSRVASAASGASSVVFQNVNIAQSPVNTASYFAMPRAATPAELPINNFMSFVSLPDAFHYLEGGAKTVHGLRAQTKLTQQTAVAENVTEPASEILLLAGLSALAIAIRRQSPS